MSLGQVCDMATQAGFEAICMRPSQLSIHSSPEEVASARETIRRQEIDVTMISGDVDIVYNNDNGPNCLPDITNHLNLAEALGAPMIRVCIKTEDDVKAARRASDESAERGITLVHQCHVQSLFETVDQIECRLRQIDRPNFGLIFEAANLEQCRQEYGSATIARLAPWIRNVYLQNQRLSPNGKVTLDTWTNGPISFDVIDVTDPGGIDFVKVLDSLKEIGYDGPITVHQSSPAEGTSPLESAKRTAEFIKSNWGS